MVRIGLTVSNPWRPVSASWPALPKEDLPGDIRSAVQMEVNNAMGPLASQQPPRDTPIVTPGTFRW